MSAALGYLSDWQVGVYLAPLTKTGTLEALAKAGALSYCALHTSDPGIASDEPGGTEATVSGSAYIRARVVWKKVGARVLESTNAQNWHGMPETLVTHLAIWDKVSGGNLRAVIPLLNPLYIASQGSYGLKAGELYLRWP